MSSVPNLLEHESLNVTNSNIPSTQSKRRKRKNKNKKQNKQLNPNLFKKKFFKRRTIQNSASKAVFTMSTWAEQFTFASTWQLKQQVAYWKAKAKSLEYENGVLHDIIRENHYVGNVKNFAPGSPTSSKLSDSSDDELNEEHVDLSGFSLSGANISVEEGTLGEWTETESSSVQNMAVDHIEASDDCSDEKNIEVSEEFIQFLMINAKHKEELRLERERQKALEEQSAMEERENKLKERRHYGLTPQELYGDRWQKISALEMSMQSKFMSDVDSTKPAHWPVIPFNFDFS